VVHFKENYHDNEENYVIKTTNDTRKITLSFPQERIICILSCIEMMSYSNIKRRVK
jgi:hypothetical protein